MDLNRVISGLTSSGVLGGLAAGAVSGAVLSNRKARKAMGQAAKVGGIAALGALAWSAYRNYQASSEAGVLRSTPPETSDPAWKDLSRDSFEIDVSEADPASRGALLVHAMIAAADSDGHMDGDEFQRIMQKVDELNLTAEEKAMIFDGLKSPMSLTELCQHVDSPGTAIEVYLASLIAIDESRSEARHYLDALAFRLGLPDELVKRIENEVKSDSLQQVA